MNQHSGRMSREIERQKMYSYRKQEIKNLALGVSAIQSLCDGMIESTVEWVRRGGGWGVDYGKEKKNSTLAAG